MEYTKLTSSEDQQLTFDKPGDYVVYFKNISGKITLDITSEGVDLYIYGLYIGTGCEIFKLETVQKHLAPNSQSNLLIKGVFRDQSKFLYQGLIRLEKDAQHSHAYQKNQNLILSKDVFIDSRPYLEILANDVFCTHGSTTGRLNESEINYIQSRGISRPDSQELLIDGFIQDILREVNERAPNARLK